MILEFGHPFDKVKERGVLLFSHFWEHSFDKGRSRVLLWKRGIGIWMKWNCYLRTWNPYEGVGWPEDGVQAKRRDVHSHPCIRRGYPHLRQKKLGEVDNWVSSCLMGDDEPTYWLYGSHDPPDRVNLLFLWKMVNICTTNAKRSFCVSLLNGKNVVKLAFPLFLLTCIDRVGKNNSYWRVWFAEIMGFVSLKQWT